MGYKLNHWQLFFYPIPTTMRSSIFVFTALIVLISTSCQKEEEKMSDAQLISAIQKAANKQHIEVAELPSVSKEVLDLDYSESYIDAAKIAPDLGYEVDMRREKGTQLGEALQAYFNLSGRELIPDAKGGKGDGKDRLGKDRKECFELVYPVSYVMPDGSRITGNNEREVVAAIKAWYAAHPDSKERPALQYPVAITFRDGTTLRVKNEQEMKRAYASCEGEKDRCFAFVYPVTFEMPDGQLVVINSEEQMQLAKRRWSEAGVRPALQYPVDVNFKGDIITLNDEAGMRRIKAACEQGKDRCFELIYPVTFIMPDGSTIRVENKEGMGAIRRWYAAHPDAEKRHSLQYPVEAFFKGKRVTVDNQEQMHRMKAACDTHRERCFSLVFPVTYIMPDGTSLTVENKEGRAVLRRWYAAHPDVKEKASLQFPVDTKWKDGSVKTIHNQEEMNRARAACD